MSESEPHSLTPGSPSWPASWSRSRPGGLSRLRALGQGRKSVWAAAATLLVLGGALVSVLDARAVASSDAEKARLAFHLSSAEIASSLKQTIQHEEDLIVNASAFFTSNPNASPADFDRWAESVHAMQRYPELQNIGLVTLVPASQPGSVRGTLGRQPRPTVGAAVGGSKRKRPADPAAG